MVLGDSLSAGYGIDVEKGWVGLLAQRLDSNETNLKVVNASISGNTTGDGLARLPQLLATHQPSLVVIALGGNDGLRGYPLKRMRQNLKRIIQLSRNTDAQVLLLGIEIPPNYGARYTQEFRNSFQTIADEHAVAFVPFILKDIALDPALMQKDGIHPKQEAQLRLLENIWPELAKLIE
jgi:acyl-CoA thioesterase-1